MKDIITDSFNYGERREFCITMDKRTTVNEYESWEVGESVGPRNGLGPEEPFQSLRERTKVGIELRADISEDQSCII